LKRFLTLFPDAENVHLTKDVGMIPYVLHRYFRYDATLACYKNGEYPYLQNEVKGLKVVFIKKIFHNKFFDSLLFLLLNFCRYDVLQLYHLERENAILLTVFKLLKLNKAITYLKLDMDERVLDFTFKTIQGRIHKFLLGKITCISIENELLCEKLNSNNLLGRAVIHITNGYFENNNIAPLYASKQNKIITVGRIGTFQKNNEVLLEAFALFAEQNSNWTLELIGGVESGFSTYINHYFLKYPQLKQRVLFCGFIADKKALADKYKEAKIFVLTSRFEGMPLVYVEAMRAGCYIISSDILAARYVTKMGQFGNLFEVGNVNELSKILLNTVHDAAKLQSNFNYVQDYVKEHFSWPTIITHLNICLQSGD
jgi:glycosyltransferase involved in cell wall biosynthesis